MSMNGIIGNLITGLGLKIFAMVGAIYVGSQVASFLTETMATVTMAMAV